MQAILFRHSRICRGSSALRAVSPVSSTGWRGDLSQQLRHRFPFSCGSVGYASGQRVRIERVSLDKSKMSRRRRKAQRCNRAGEEGENTSGNITGATV